MGPIKCQLLLQAVLDHLSFVDTILDNIWFWTLLELSVKQLISTLVVQQQQLEAGTFLSHSTHVAKKTWAVLQDVSSITLAPLVLSPPLGTCPPILLLPPALPPPTCKIKIIKSVSEDQAECVIFVGLLGILMVLLLPSPVLD